MINLGKTNQKKEREDPDKKTGDEKGDITKDFLKSRGSSETILKIYTQYMESLEYIDKFLDTYVLPNQTGKI